jgi:ATP-binding cassette, subfamily B, bacterial
MQICLVMGASRRLRREVEREVAAEAEMQAWGAEVLRGATDVKALGREAYAIERWSILAERRGELSESRQRVGSMVEAAISGMGLCSLLGLLILGAHEVLAERLALGAMLALNALAGGALIPLDAMTRSLQRFLMARARREPLRDALSVPLDRQPAKALDAPAGAVRVERLCFRYQHGGPLALDDVSFAAEAGELVAIVGRAGSGKSTLARLLAGLHTPTSGRVSFDRWPLSVAEQRRAREH